MTRVVPADVEEELAQPCIKYLLEPYENGFWELRAHWNLISNFSNDLLEKAGTLSDFENDSEFQHLGPQSCNRNLSDEKRIELLQITNRLSTAHLIFDAISRENNGHAQARFVEAFEWISHIDIDSIREKFSSAAKIYEERIYFEGIRRGVNSEQPFRLKEGLVFFLEVPKNRNMLHVVANRREELQAIADFYFSLGLISSNQVQRIFAPDEALFKPYFSVLSAVFSQVVRDEQIAHSFSQALDYYKDADFQHCISTLGLIAEGYLQRIYSTLLREENSSGLTLGQILDRIHRRIGDFVNPPKAVPKSADGVYEMIKMLDSGMGLEALKPVLRELVHLIQENRTTLGKRIDEITKVNARSSPFPTQVLENITELLKWRNAASHNSRVPLAAHEADRTLYCLVRVITWWQDQLQKLDWSKTKQELLEELVQAAK